MPYEALLAGPFLIYLADVGARKPTRPIGAGSTPVVRRTSTIPVSFTHNGTTWELLAKEYYDEEGFGVDHSQEINYTRIHNLTGPVAAHRSEEDIALEVGIKDTSLETMAILLNDKAVLDTPAGSGVRGSGRLWTYGVVRLLLNTPCLCSAFRLTQR